MQQKSVNIIGAGKLGGALAIALERCGFQIASLVVRTEGKITSLLSNLYTNPTITAFGEIEFLPSAEVCFITTPDFVIEQTAETLAKLEWIRREKPFVFHTSGALSADVLRELAKIGCPTASFHPLASASDALSGAERFSGAFFALEGDTKAVELGTEIVKLLQGRSFRLAAGNKTLYHAAAVTACGHFVALFDAAQAMLTECGLDSSQAKEILLPLVGGTFENLSHRSNSASLTGTFARADLETMRRHLAAIGNLSDKNLLDIYQTLGKHSLKLALEQNADGERLAQMQRELDESDDRTQT